MTLCDHAARLVAVICMMQCSCNSAAQAISEVVEPFQATNWPAGISARHPDSIPVLPDFQQLCALNPGSALRLDVSVGVSLSAWVDRIERRSATQYSVVGNLGDDSSFFVLAVEHTAVAGLIHAPLFGQRYRIGYVANGVHEVESVAGRKFGACATESEPIATLPSVGESRYSAAPRCLPGEGSSSMRGSCPAPPQHFDAMIYYTAAARLEAGSTDAMNCECQLAVDTANITYVNSGIPAQMVLVFRGEITYPETGVIELDRDLLQFSGDGNMDNVHGERDEYGGDFVTLFVSKANYPSVCGIAYCLPGGSDYGFCVVNRDCASTDFSYAHEVGHLQGCAHNREDAGTDCNYYCDSFGHRFAGDTGVWRTVMSYDLSPPGPTEIIRIGWFSNPLVDFDGVPTGASGDCDVSTNNAGTILGTTSSREQWRNPRFEVWVGPANTLVYGTFEYPWWTVLSGVTAIYDGAAVPLVQPTLWIKEGTYSEALTISKPMTIRSCGGVARVGG